MLKTLPIETCSKNPEIAKSIDPHKRHCRLRKVSTTAYKMQVRILRLMLILAQTKVDPPTACPLIDKGTRGTKPKEAEQ